MKDKKSFTWSQVFWSLLGFGLMFYSGYVVLATATYPFPPVDYFILSACCLILSMAFKPQNPI